MMLQNKSLEQKELDLVPDSDTWVFTLKKGLRVNTMDVCLRQTEETVR